jgi:hypothetical protein
MAYGLQVYGNKGNLLVDISDRFTRLHSQANLIITAGTVGSKVIPVAGMANNGLWLVNYPNICNITNLVIGTGSFTVTWDATYGKTETVLLSIMRL